MQVKILFLILWAIGLIGMPLAVFIYSKSVHIQDTNDTSHIRTITGWGMTLTGGWFALGGLILLLLLSSQQ